MENYEDKMARILIEGEPRFRVRTKGGTEFIPLSIRKEITGNGCIFHFEEDLLLKSGDTLIIESEVSE